MGRRPHGGPGGKMPLAMQLIFTPMIWNLIERKHRASENAYLEFDRRQKACAIEAGLVSEWRIPLAAYSAFAFHNSPDKGNLWRQ
jgi:hypothetical protein